MSIISVGIIIVFVAYVVFELSAVAKDAVVEKIRRGKRKWAI